ncbi:MAG: hypothetical protein ACXAC5_02150 [Promethearchaeota archaeon]
MLLSLLGYMRYCYSVRRQDRSLPCNRARIVAKARSRALKIRNEVEAVNARLRERSY